MYIVGLKRVYLKIPGIAECRYTTMPEVSELSIRLTASGGTQGAARDFSFFGRNNREHL